MMSIKEIIYSIIDSEGGYVNHKNDSGGPTNYGITLATLSSWYGRRATISELKKIKPADAYKIYEQKYYYGTGIDELPKVLQPVILDITINSWIKVATVILQRAINTLNNDEAVEVDGKLGPRTVLEAKKLARVKEKELINTIVRLRKEFYRGIVEDNPSQIVFLAGWLNRANRFIV